MSLSVSHDYTVTGSRIPRTRVLRNSRLSAQSSSPFAPRRRKKVPRFLLIIAKIRAREWNETQVERINRTNRIVILSR